MKFMQVKRQAFGSLLAVLVLGGLMVSHTGASDLRLEFLVGGLRSPLFLTHAGDGSGRTFILEQSGRIRIFNGTSLVGAPFLDISARVRSGGETGLLGLAFHPNFAANRRFFVNYTRLFSGQLQTVVAEYQASAGNPNVADSNERILLTIDQPFPNHNGGWIGFGPDGNLYIASGDGGSGGDPLDHGQNVNSLLGAILRIEVDSELPYGIPASNPFVGQAGADEIFAYGLRNPWRASFDRATGDFFAGDVGQNSLEEVDLIVNGGNYGWNTAEGSNCFPPGSNCNMSGLVPPIDDYGRTEGGSITGGYVYRGPESTAHQGDYIFGDFNSGNVWSLRQVSPGNWQRTLELSTDPFVVASFGEDEVGTLYMVSLGGAVFEVVFGTPPAEADLSVTKIAQAASVLVGENSTFSITVANAGPNTAQAVRLVDTLPDQLAFGSATPSQGNCLPSGALVTCNLGDLASGASALITLQAAVLVAGEISNTARVDSTTNDPNPANDVATAIFSGVEPPTDLVLVKSIEVAETSLNVPVTFHLEVTNNGPAVARDVILHDPLPAGLAFQAATSPTFNCTAAENSVVCTLGSLGINEVAVADIVAVASRSGTFENVATVRFDGEDAAEANNTSQASLSVLGPADLVIEKRLLSGLFPGRKSSYRIRVSNQGEIASSAPITVTDDLPAPLAFFASEAPEWDCTAEANLLTCLRDTPIQPSTLR